MSDPRYSHIPGYGSNPTSSTAPPPASATATFEPKTMPSEMVQVAASVSKTFLQGSADGSDWTWEQLRDYAVEGIERNVGHFPRNAVTEASIFKSFKNRWGEAAGPIVKYAIDECGGVWQGAPISVNRFAKGSDPYFAQPLAERLGFLAPAS